MAIDFSGGFDIQSVLPKLQSKSPEELKAIGQRMDADQVPLPPGLGADTSALNVPGLANAPQAAPQQPELPGLQGAISPTFAGLPQDPAVDGAGAATPSAQPSTWEQFLSDPATMLQMSAALLAPRQAGTSDLGHAVSGIAGGVTRLASKRKERTETEAATKEAASKQALRGAQGEQITAKTKAGEQDREIDRDFKIAKTELARAQAGAAGKKGAGAAKSIQKEAMIKALFTTRPDKYASIDEARVAWETFEQTKGRDPLLEAAMTNIFLAPKAERDTLMKGIFDSLDTSALGEPAAGPTAVARQEVDKIPASKWLSLEGVNSAERARAEDVYGKDVVARKIAEAKGIK